MRGAGPIAPRRLALRGGERGGKLSDGCTGAATGQLDGAGKIVVRVQAEKRQRS